MEDKEDTDVGVVALLHGESDLNWPRSGDAFLSTFKRSVESSSVNVGQSTISPAGKKNEKFNVNTKKKLWLTFYNVLYIL